MNFKDIISHFELLQKKLNNTIEPGEVINEASKIKLTVITSVFLILISVSANFVGDTLSTDVKKFLNNNNYAKFTIIFSLIYFSISLSSQAGNIVLPPIYIVLLSFVIFIFYLLFLKCHFYFSVIIFILLFSLLIMSNYIYFYNDPNNDLMNDKQKLNNIHKIKILFEIVFSIIIVFLFINLMVYIHNK